MPNPDLTGLGWPWEGEFDEWDALQAECEWEALYGGDDAT